MKSKEAIFKKILELENEITMQLGENPYKHGIPIQSNYYQNLASLRATVDALVWTTKSNVKEGKDMKNTKVISGFPATGKSYFQQGCRNIEGLIILDSDSSNFSWIEKGVRHPEFPNNYMKHIRDNIGKVDIIFVSSHDNVRQALKDSNIDYTLVYPDISLKDQYIERYKNRGNDENFIKFIDSNWENFIKEMDTEIFPTKIKLKENEFMADVIGMV